ncbi:glycosyltransferase [Oceaniglobus trochenteri]|uniref:glycosyltransferase n=1 Tax=Oceaniglobus trochenteri TaxID=2763260 RepID=UPI001FD9E782
MGTCNGAAHLDAQLQSIAAQTHGEWSLHVSDDGSVDDTCAIVRSFAESHPGHTVTLVKGPGRGSAANFLSLAERGGWPEGAWLAFCDQDDVWMPDRLQHALALAQQQDADRPVVYASRTIVTDAALRPRRESRRHPHPPAFGNALVQNVLAGNTLVLNPVAAEILHRTAPLALRDRGVPHHDWWIYLLMTGLGACVINDDRPGLYYRQHSGNLLGANRGAGKLFSRLSMIWDRQYATWIDCNIAALMRVGDHLTPENRACLARFRAWRENRGRGARAGGPKAAGVWRQSAAGDLMIRLAAAVGRF